MKDQQTQRNYKIVHPFVILSKPTSVRSFWNLFACAILKTINCIMLLTGIRSKFHIAAFKTRKISLILTIKRLQKEQVKQVTVELNSTANSMANAFQRVFIKPQSKIKNILVQPEFHSKQYSNSISKIFSGNLK